MPADQHGESIVMRILDKESSCWPAGAGFFTDDQQTFERMIGMPTASAGHRPTARQDTTSTRCSLINRPTADHHGRGPVEYSCPHQPGAGERGGGLTFSAALRSMLRQAPT